MEACLLKLAASWAIAPCFRWQGFRLHKQDTALKELARCQQATSLGRILLTVVNRWDWEEGWAHTFVCVRNMSSVEWEARKLLIVVNHNIWAECIEFLIHSNWSFVWYLVNCDSKAPCSTLCVKPGTSVVLSAPLLCYLCYKESRDWGGFSSSYLMYLFTKCLIY